MKTISVRIPEALFEKLDSTARREDRSISNMTERILSEKLSGSEEEPKKELSK